MNSGNRLKIVFIDPFGVAGLAHYNYCLCQALARRGVQVTLLTSTLYSLDALWPHSFRVDKMVKMWSPLDPSSMAHAGRFVTKLRKGLLYSWGMTKMVGRILRECPDIVHLSESFFAIDILFLALLKVSVSKLTHTCHNVKTFKAKAGRVAGRGWIGDQIHRLIYRCYDRIIFHAEENRDEYLKVFGGDCNRTTVIPHGNYAILADATSMSTAEARAGLGLPEDGKVVLFFGIIRRYKGLPDLIRAFSAVARDIPDATLVVAGAPYSDSDLDLCQQIAEEVRVSARIRWDLRYVPEPEVSRYFVSADVVVLPYRKIYQSGILQLAYAHGRPVVATEVGGLPAAVKHGHTGLLVPPEDPQALAEAIVSLLSDEDLAARMGAEGRRFAESSFDWGDIAARTEALYREVLN